MASQVKDLMATGLLTRRLSVRRAPIVDEGRIVGILPLGAKYSGSALVDTSKSVANS